MANDADRPMTFEQAVARLEQVVRDLEAGDRPLDEALGLFQEGVELARFCQRLLDAAEGKVEKLLDLQNGVAVTEPFEPGGGG